MSGRRVFARLCRFLHGRRSLGQAPGFLPGAVVGGSILFLSRLRLRSNGHRLGAAFHVGFENAHEIRRDNAGRDRTDREQKPLAER